MKIIKQKSNELDTKTIERIVNDLTTRKQQILDDLEVIAQKDERTENAHQARFPDFGDKAEENAQEIDEYSTNLATEKVLESTLRDINNALERIAKGEYGICKYCKKDIGRKRMLARPVASSCVECKEKLQNAV